MSRTILIAEAGVNHNGDMAIAKKLIKVAADAGADYVKFQTFKTTKLVSRTAQKAKYQVSNSGGNDISQFQMLKKLELSDENHEILYKYAEELNIKFLSTGFDESSIDYLDKLGIDFFKIPSGEITNKPYLQHVARKGKSIVLSTGMASLKEIGEALDILISEGLTKEEITVLHCNTEYPTPMKDVNLLAMQSIAKKFDVKVGYSDHTLGIEVPVAATALGATMIEKHFTLSRDLDGPDHAASLEPGELSEMVNAIRNIEFAISGSGEKNPSPSEIKNKRIARKSIHLENEMKAGDVIKREDLIMIRPGDGISPMEIDDVIGRKINQDLPKGHKLQKSNFQDV